MKRIFILSVIVCTALTGFTQNEQDTIKVGGLNIIRKPGKNKEYKMPERKRGHNSNIRTNWWIVDLGFANYNDNTVYGLNTPADQYAPGSNSSWLALRSGKSVDVNIWFFMQRLNLAKHVLNLQYGLGLELNNYRYKQNIRYDANPPAISDAPIVSLDNTPNRSYKKDKLATDYLTAPVMLNVNFTPGRHGDGFGFSGGISAGWLYSARNKTVTSDEGKKKAKDDFDLDRWKISYVGELTLGPVKLYGSIATKSIYKRGLDITPYNFGIRFSNW